MTGSRPRRQGRLASPASEARRLRALPSQTRGRRARPLGPKGALALDFRFHATVDRPGTWMSCRRRGAAIEDFARRAGSMTSSFAARRTGALGDAGDFRRFLPRHGRPCRRVFDQLSSTSASPTDLLEPGHDRDLRPTTFAGVGARPRTLCHSSTSRRRFRLHPQIRPVGRESTRPKDLVDILLIAGLQAARRQHARLSRQPSTNAYSSRC